MNAINVKRLLSVGYESQMDSLSLEVELASGKSLAILLPRAMAPVAITAMVAAIDRAAENDWEATPMLPLTCAQASQALDGSPVLVLGLGKQMKLALTVTPEILDAFEEQISILRALPQAERGSPN